MSRLFPIDRDQLPVEQRRFHDAVIAIRRRPVSGPFIVLMNSSPDLAARFAHLGHYFHSRGQADESILSLRVRTFVALLGSRALDVPYEWSAWVGWAIQAGVPRDTIDAIRERRQLPNLTREDALVHDFCTQLMSAKHRVSATTYQSALDHFGAQGLVELVMTLGYFAMIAFPLNAFEMEMSAAQIAMRKPYAPLLVDADSVAARPRTGVRQFANQPRQTGSRIPMITRQGDLKPENQHFLDRIVRTRGQIAPAFQILLHTPDVADRVANVGAFVLYESILSPQIKSVVWLITAREFDCEYEWDSAVADARNAGIAEESIDGILTDVASPGVSEDQQAVIAFCHELTRGNHHVSAATYRAAVGRLGVAPTVQIAATLGYFAMMAFVLNAFEVRSETCDESKPSL